MSSLPWPAATIPRLISQLRYHFRCCDPSSDNMHNIICGRWRRGHQICHFFTPSWTPSTISWPMCPVLSSFVSSAETLIIPHNCCFSHPPSTPSSHISFVVLVISPLYHISFYDVSIAPLLHHHLCCHPYPPSLSSNVSASVVLVNLHLSWRSHLLPSPPPPISS